MEAVATAAQGLMSSPIAVALAWVRDKPGVSAPIVGARTLGQLVAALASETLTLPDEIRCALDDVSAPPRNYPESPGLNRLAAREGLPVSEDEVFAAFCAAGLWAGLGRTLAAGAARLPASGRRHDVSLVNLARLPKVGQVRAGRLLSAFLAAAPEYELVEMLVPAGLDARLAARIMDTLGPPAPRLLREDPWRLLTLGGVTPVEADRLAAGRDSGRDAGTIRAAARARSCRTCWPTRRGTDTPSVDRTDAAQLLGGVGRGRPAGRQSMPRWRAHSVVADPDDTIALSALRRGGGGDRRGRSPGCRPVPNRSARPRRSRRSRVGQGDGPTSTRRNAERSSTRCAAGVSVLTGGPGTGKSRTVAALVALAEAAGQHGRARRTDRPGGQATGGTVRAPRRRPCTGCSAPQPRQRGDEVRFSAGFARDRDWPLDEDVVVVDETSHARRRAGRTRCSTPAPTAPICSSSVTRPSCPRSVRAGCSATSSTRAPCR